MQALELRDIHLPDSIGWWPPAIGWWLLALLLILAVFLMIYWIRRITRKTALKSAKKLLIQIEQDDSLNAVDKLTALSSLLRRVAISIYPRTAAASLTGQAWLEFLDSSVNDSPFTKGAGSLLATAHYRNNLDQELDIAAVHRLCEAWLNAQKSKQ